MKCPRCQSQNPHDARFCEECGARLELTCPNCGAVVTTGKKFCRSCGTSLATEPTGRFASPEAYTPKHLAEKILTSKSALEGERKQVTILFADLKGSMELLADRDPEEARKLLDPVLELLMLLGRYHTAIDFLTRVVEGPDSEPAKRRLGGLAFGSPYSLCSGWAAWCLAQIGDFDRAVSYADRAVHAADALDHPSAQAFAYICRAIPLVAKGDFALALPWLERAVHLGETKGLILLLPIAYSALGRASAWQGRTSQGLTYFNQAATLSENLGAKSWVSQRHAWWAEVLVLARDMPEAKRIADKGVEIARANKEQAYEAEALCLLAEIFAEGTPPDVQSSQSYYEQAKTLAEGLGMRPLQAHCYLGLGKLYRRMGKSQEARAHLTTAATMYREMDMRFWLEQAEAELKGVSGQRPR